MTEHVPPGACRFQGFSALAARGLHSKTPRDSDTPFPYDWLTTTLDETLTLAPDEAAKPSASWLDSVCTTLAKRDPERLREWLATLSEDARVRANASYYPALARHDADAAFAWLATLPPDGLGSPVEAQRAFSAAAWSALEKLNQWIASQPPGPLRDAASAARAFSLAGRAYPEKAIASYGDALPFDTKGETAARLALSATQKDPAATLAWLTALPPGMQQDRAARTAAEAWTWRDPTAAAEWVESLPARPLRNSAIAGYAPVAMHADPAAAAASVERISAPATKQAAAEKVFQVWLGENPIAARRWLRSLAGVESAWVEKTLRSTP